MTKLFALCTTSNPTKIHVFFDLATFQRYRLPHRTLGQFVRIRKKYPLEIGPLGMSAMGLKSNERNEIKVYHFGSTLI